jgi:hypothetical protein
MSGNYPPGSPAEWLAEGYVTCNIQCHGGCDRLVDVRLDTLPQDLLVAGRPAPCLQRMWRRGFCEHRAKLA